MHNTEGRTCTCCKQFKAWDSFSNSSNKGSINAKAAQCKACFRVKDAKRRKRLQEKEGITTEGRICTCCNTFKVWKEFPAKRAEKNNIHPRVCSKCKAIKVKKDNAKLQNLKTTNWELWQARALRSRWLSRFKKVNPHIEYSEVPTLKEIEKWLHTLDYHCHFTQVPLDRSDIQYDHLNPVSRKGSFRLSNVAVVTGEINRLKGEMNETEFKQLLTLMQTWEHEGKYLKAMLKRSSLIFNKR